MSDSAHGFVLQANQQFLPTCYDLHDHLPANGNYKQHIAKMLETNTADERALTGSVKSNVRDGMTDRSLSASVISTSSGPWEPFRPGKWPMPSAFTPAMYAPRAISSRMAELLEGSTPEPRNSNWHKQRNTDSYW